MGIGRGTRPLPTSRVIAYGLRVMACAHCAGSSWAHIEQARTGWPPGPRRQLLTIGPAGRNLYIEQKTIFCQSGGTRDGRLPEVRSSLLR